MSEMPLDPSGSWMRREPSLQPQTLTAHCPRPLSAVLLGSGGCCGCPTRTTEVSPVVCRHPREGGSLGGGCQLPAAGHQLPVWARLSPPDPCFV